MKKIVFYFAKGMKVKTTMKYDDSYQQMLGYSLSCKNGGKSCGTTLAYALVIFHPWLTTYYIYMHRPFPNHEIKSKISFLSIFEENASISITISIYSFLNRITNYMHVS